MTSKNNTKIAVYSDFHTPQTDNQGNKVSMRPSMAGYEEDTDVTIFSGDGTQSKRRPEGFSAQDAVDELYHTLRDFADIGGKYTIPGNHDMAGEFNQNVNQDYIIPGADDTEQSPAIDGNDVYTMLVGSIDGLEDIEGQDVELGDVVIVGGYNHEEPEFPRYADDVVVPSSCDIDQERYQKMENQGRVTQETVDQLIDEIESAYEMDIEQAIEDDVVGSIMTDKEKSFAEAVLEPEQDPKETQIPSIYPVERKEENYAPERLVNQVIKDISTRYNMPADEAVDQSLDKELMKEHGVTKDQREEERQFVETISHYADKKLSLIERLEEAEEKGKTAIIPTHGAPNGKRTGSAIDKITAPVPRVQGRNYGSVVVEEVAPHFEDTIQAIIGGHIHEGVQAHEDGKVEYFGEIPVINPGNGGIAELDLDEEGQLYSVQLHDIHGKKQALEL